MAAASQPALLTGKENSFNQQFAELAKREERFQLVSTDLNHSLVNKMQNL